MEGSNGGQSLRRPLLSPIAESPASPSPAPRESSTALHHSEKKLSEPRTAARSSDPSLASAVTQQPAGSHTPPTPAAQRTEQQDTLQGQKDTQTEGPLEDDTTIIRRIGGDTERVASASRASRALIASPLSAGTTPASVRGASSQLLTPPSMDFGKAHLSPPHSPGSSGGLLSHSSPPHAVCGAGGGTSSKGLDGFLNRLRGAQQQLEAATLASVSAAVTRSHRHSRGSSGSDPPCDAEHPMALPGGAGSTKTSPQGSVRSASRATLADMATTRRGSAAHRAELHAEADAFCFPVTAPPEAHVESTAKSRRSSQAVESNAGLAPSSAFLDVNTSMNAGSRSLPSSALPSPHASPRSRRRSSGVEQGNLAQMARLSVSDPFLAATQEEEEQNDKGDARVHHDDYLPLPGVPAGAGPTRTAHSVPDQCEAAHGEAPRSHALPTIRAPQGASSLSASTNSRGPGSTFSSSTWSLMTADQSDEGSHEGLARRASHSSRPSLFRDADGDGNSEHAGPASWRRSTGNFSTHSATTSQDGSPHSAREAALLKMNSRLIQERKIVVEFLKQLQARELLRPVGSALVAAMLDKLAANAVESKPSSSHRHQAP